VRIGLSAQIVRREPTGVETYVMGLLSALAAEKTGHTLLVYGPDCPALRDLPAGLCLRLSRMPVCRTLRVLYEQVLLPILVRRDRLDVFHSPAYVLPRGLAGIPAVLTLPDTFALTRPCFCRLHNRVYYRCVLPGALRRANRIITLSDTQREEIIRTSDVEPQRIVTIPPGLTVCRAEDPGVPGPLVLYVGNFDPKKNIPFLIAAFERLRSETALPHKLVLVGKHAWKHHDVRRVAERSPVRRDILMPGYVSEPIKWGFYRHAALCVYASQFEGFGFPPVEAAAAGTPVLVPDIPVFRETVPGAAFFRPMDVGDCANAMARLLVQPVRQNIDVGRYSWPQHARRCLELYERVKSKDDQSGHSVHRPDISVADRDVHRTRD
jgi:glycosyltransferase involved in cell wall biosynthesis